MSFYTGNGINGKITVLGSIRWENAAIRRMGDERYIDGFGYKVYSQNDEDGCIDEIFRRIGTETKRFVEFGVQNGLECNSHWLLHRGWKGLFIEGNENMCKEMKIRFKPVIKNGKLTVYNSFITRENIDNLIARYVGKENIDFLSIDIDGNDYYVWEAIQCVHPRLVCIEYNGKFPPDYEWKQAYDPDHKWINKCDWFGTSLKAMENLGREKGYTLVGTSIAGANAFFVRNDLVQDKFPEPYTAEMLFNPLGGFRIKYGAGHPAFYCLVDQEDYKGERNYIETPDELKLIMRAEVRDVRIKKGRKLVWFPFEKVEAGSNIVIYGGGYNGRLFAEQIDRIKYCTVKYIIDEYTGLKEWKGIPVKRMRDADMVFDRIVISIGDKSTASKVKRTLLEMGVLEEKIIAIAI